MLTGDERFRTALLRWYDADHRDLPWRGAGDPWAIWISEVMLQQTRVEAVRQIYSRFLLAYPTPAALARASDDELLAAWQGLGYYRRAKALREGAQAVCDEHDGAVPSDLEALGRLPGIGAYTRGAIGSIAFGHPVPAIDGNVERVASRHRGIRTVVKREPGATAVREAVAAWLDARRPGDFNQALMELGATVCTPRQPRCDVCPVAADCIARREGCASTLPVLPPRRPFLAVASRAVLVPWKSEQVLGYRVPDGEVNAGQVDLPGAGILVGVDDEATLAAVLGERFGMRWKIGQAVGQVRHGITHHRITLTASWAECRGILRPPLLAAAADDPAVPWTTSARKVFRLAARL